MLSFSEALWAECRDRGVQVAKTAFPKGCPAMRMRDELGAIYDDQMFAAAYPARGQPAHPPWRLPPAPRPTTRA